MSLVHQYSNPVVRSQVDLFSCPPTDTTVESSFYSEVKPTVNVSNSSAKLEFRIIGNSSHYLDFADHFLYIKFQILSEDGTVLKLTDDVSVVNLTLHSLFSQVCISLHRAKSKYENITIYLYLFYRLMCLFQTLL